MNSAKLMTAERVVRNPVIPYDAKLLKATIRLD